MSLSPAGRPADPGGFGGRGEPPPDSLSLLMSLQWVCRRPGGRRTRGGSGGRGAPPDSLSFLMSSLEDVSITFLILNRCDHWFSSRVSIRINNQSFLILYFGLCWITMASINTYQKTPAYQKHVAQRRVSKPIRIKKIQKSYQTESKRIKNKITTWPLKFHSSWSSC